MHRIGRTGRAGHAGVAVSFCDFEEKEYLADIEKLTHIRIPSVEHEWPMQVFEKEENVPVYVQHTYENEELEWLFQSAGVI